MDAHLQWALLALGVFLLAVIYAMNKWQEMKSRRQSRMMFVGEQQDVLMEDRVVKRSSPGEPTLDLPQKPTQLEESLGPPINEPTFILTKLDAMAALMAPQPIQQNKFWPIQKRVLGGLFRPVVWLGLDENEGLWRQLDGQGHQSFGNFRAGMQLVNRRGPVSETDIQLFHEGLDQLGQELNCRVRYQPLSEVLAQTEEVNRFCVAMDVQVCLSLVRHAQETFAMTHVDEVARDHLFRMSKGVYVYRDENGELIFSLVNIESAKFEAGTLHRLATRGVTFVLDVPLVSQPLVAFDLMVEQAKSMAQRLGGILVDDNRMPVGEPQISLIRKSIEAIEGRMGAWEIAPAGPLARRLCS